MTQLAKAIEEGEGAEKSLIKIKPFRGDGDWLKETEKKIQQYDTGDDDNQFK
ncbi:27189_t:CDS:2, partial [Racocetra persica]